MENIDDFNLGCALILARLYEAFPVAVTLDVRPLAADAVGGLDHIERRRAVFSATVRFLAEEGFLTYSSKAGPGDGDVFSGCRLTARGLAQLSKTPEAIRPPAKTLGERIVSWTREAGSGAALEAVRALIAQALG